MAAPSVVWNTAWLGITPYFSSADSVSRKTSYRKISQSLEGAIWGVKCSHRFQIWQASRQQCSSYRSRAFETLRDLAIRCLMRYCIGPQNNHPTATTDMARSRGEICVLCVQSVIHLISVIVVMYAILCYIGPCCNVCILSLISFGIWTTPRLPKPLEPQESLAAIFEFGRFQAARGEYLATVNESEVALWSCTCVLHNNTTTPLRVHVEVWEYYGLSRLAMFTKTYKHILWHMHAVLLGFILF